MINLCDNTKYFTDRILADPAKRIPRSVEDIEIVGNISKNETIDFSQLSGQCNIQQISSLRINFSEKQLQLEIIGNGPNSSINTREPSGTELTKIKKSDPLRYSHGWYTINPDFTIGVLSTNGNIKLTNLGFNNSRTECADLILNNSIIANNVLFVNKILLENNSRAYDCQFTTNKFLAKLDTKMDNIVLKAETANYSGGSYYNCQLYHSNLFMGDNTILLDSILNLSTGQIKSSQIMRSKINANENSSLIIENNTNISGSSITSDRLYLNGGTSRDSSIKTALLYTSDQDHTIYNGIISSDLVENSSFINFGILLFNKVQKLNLINNAQTEISHIYKNNSSNISNNPGSMLNITTSGYLNMGTNSGTILGGTIDIDTGFNNSISGIILSKQCNLYNSCINEGSIRSCNLYNSATNSGTILSIGNFYDTSINNGIISVGNFYNTSKNNDGFIDIGNFYDTSQNVSANIQQAVFYSDSTNIAHFSGNFVGSLIFKNNSKNQSNGIYNAQFYNSGFHEGPCYNTKFYDFSQFKSGPLIDVSFYDQSKQSKEAGKTEVNKVNFYDSSQFTELNISGVSGFFHMYDNTSGNILINSTSNFLECTINNNAILSFVSGSTLPSGRITINDNANVESSYGFLILDFQNQSTCGSSTCQVNLYDSAVATGTNYSGIITAYNNSVIANTGNVAINISSLILKNNSRCLSKSTLISKAELYDQSEFYGNSITSGYIYNNAKLMFSGDLTSTYLAFMDKALNNSSINATLIVFSGNSSNGLNGTITSDKAIFDQSTNYGQLKSKGFFKNNSINRYNRPLPTLQPYYFLDSFNYGSGNNTMHFGSGAINYGYVENGFFYQNSANQGIVKNGVFDSSVTQTGTVIGNISISGISWSDPF